MLMLWLAALAVDAAPLKVAFIADPSHPAYREYGQALRQALAGDGTITWTEQTREADLVIAAGERAAREVENSSAPVLYTMISQHTYSNLGKAARHAAIYLDQPLERQLDLLEAALPQARDIGVIYSSPTEELNRLRKLAMARGRILHARQVEQENALAGTLKALLEESTVLLVLPDEAILNAGTIRNILLETYRVQVPMVGLSASYVRAGALCAVYSTPQQIARQTVTALVQFAATGKLPLSQHSNEFEVQVNRQVARSLGLHVPDAEQLRAQMRREP